jgi:flagellum-specific ATP synthase
MGCDGRAARRIRRDGPAGMIDATWRMRIQRLDTVRRTGRLRSIRATSLEADGPSVPLGSLCVVEGPGLHGPIRAHAEVIHIDRERVILSPLEDATGLAAGASVTAISSPHQVRVGALYLGRVIDALGRPLDAAPTPLGGAQVPLYGEPPAPLDRRSPPLRLDTGIRAIDGLLPLARGQRVFAAAGVGKTSLLTQLAHQTAADVTIVALIGERGREVEAFWEKFPAAARQRATLVAATSDQAPAMRIRAVHLAMAQAEYWRAQGKHVLLLIDSITRFAMALREIGLAAGEPPTVRAYTPNVFATLPKLVERAGAIRSGGAISTIMTILSEADEVDDPISEVMKSLLDGHIVLSRSLAEQGHFPAIDILRSVSRQASGLLSVDERDRVRRIGGWLAAFEQSRMTREAGLYVSGSDETIDAAVASRASLVDFLRQPEAQHASRDEIAQALARMAGREVLHARG